MLIDTNGDGVKAEREFAGSHRYNTAVALAKRFASDEGSISTVILASGETQVDAVTASGLAGNLNAPVLLTRSSRLPHNVARFIDEQNVTDVVIVGGTAAVSDAVVTALESLGSRPNVSRVSGADRYATAAAIGGELGGPNPTWCGSDQSAAILVNGGSEGRADAIAIGPMAFRLGLPMLLTGADELPEATSAFLTDNKVERVVVVGGMTSVSDGIVDSMVEDVGVVNVQRISGGSAAATSVMVAKEMLGNCAAVLQTNQNLVALVNRDATADGIAAAPVLGRGLGDAGSVPILLVGDELPAAVSDYLASTADVRAGMKTHLEVVAIGGTAVVSTSVMTDAVAAAKTSSGLTATITPLVYNAGTLAAAQAGTTPFSAVVPGAASKSVGDYETRFSVTFSDDVKEPGDADNSGTANDSAADRVGTVLDPTMYRLNGRRLQAFVATADETGAVNDLIFTANRTVTIMLSHHLEAGDTITVNNVANEAAGGRLGANADLRTLEEASLTLGAVTTAVDRNAPVVEVVAVSGQTTFDILVSEPNVLHSEIFQNGAAGANLTDFLSVEPHNRDSDRRTTGITVAAAAKTALSGAGQKANGRADVNVRYEITATPALQHGDVIVIERKAILDRGGRGSPLIRYTVPRVKTGTPGPVGSGNLEVQSVSIGNYVHGAQANADISTDMDVLAKAGGVASGARGNGWTIFGYDDRAQGQASTNAFEIDVAVDIANQRISYTISDALPIRPHRLATIGDLAAALVSNDDFNANFALRYEGGTRPTAGKRTALTATNAAGVDFSGGMSSVGVVVKFNAAIASAFGDLTALAGDIAGRFTGTPVISIVNPDNEVHISYTSASMAELPTRAGFRVIAANRATGYGDTSVTPNVTAETNVREILNSLRPDASITP